MRQFQATTIERRKIFNGVIQSQPIEAGWASEAIFFLIVEEIELNTGLSIAVEISADGINWIHEGTNFPPMNGAGHYFVKVKHFGNWLRVNGKIVGGNSQAKLSVHLHLKS
jgi:hypothetical protein